ncbi:MAG: urea transport system permease protein [Frankiaceae bacterium]|jgi:urea transport system permease protein|nr:urea transport system permease protein [Frankiaceae bacterium]
MIWLSTVFTGLSIGSILLLIALGLTYTFGQMGVINMAHGEFIMAGAYTAYMIQKVVHDPTASLALALPAAFVVAGVMGIALEVTLIRRLYGRPLDTLLVTFGVSLILQQQAKDRFGAPNVNVRAPEWLSGGLNVGSITLPYTRMAIMVLVALVLAAVALATTKLPAGRQMRAVVQNRNLAAVSGIRTGRVDRTTFFLGSGLAGVAGVALTLMGSIGFSLGTKYIVDAFLVVVVGGLGQLRGAVIAALALGLLSAGSETFIGQLHVTDSASSLAKVVVFISIVVFLQVRPQGLVAVRSRSIA